MASPVQAEANEFASLRRNGEICSRLICGNLLIYRDQARLLAIWPAVGCPSSQPRSGPLARLPQVNVPIHGTGANSAEDLLLPMPTRSLQTRIIALFLLLIFPVVLLAAVSYITTYRDLTSHTYDRRQALAFLAEHEFNESGCKLAMLGAFHERDRIGAEDRGASRFDITETTFAHRIDFASAMKIDDHSRRRVTGRDESRDA